MLKKKILIWIIIMLFVPFISSAPDISTDTIEKIDFDGKVILNEKESTSKLNTTIELTKGKLGQIEEIKITIRQDIIIPEQNITTKKLKKPILYEGKFITDIPIIHNEYNVTIGYFLITYKPTVSKYNDITSLKEIKIKNIMQEGAEICQVIYATEFSSEFRSNECV